MAFAMQFPEGTNKGGRGKTSILDIEVSKPYITKARYVLRNSPMMEGERYPRRCLSANVHRRYPLKNGRGDLFRNANANLRWPIAAIRSKMAVATLSGLTPWRLGFRQFFDSIGRFDGRTCNHE